MEFFLIVISALLFAWSVFIVFFTGASGLVLGIWIFTGILSLFNLIRLTTR